MKLKCKKKDCLYEWDYNGVAKFYTSCPRCKYSVKVGKTAAKKKAEA